MAGTGEPASGALLLAWLARVQGQAEQALSLVALSANSADRTAMNASMHKSPHIDALLDPVDAYVGHEGQQGQQLPQVVLLWGKRQKTS